MNIQQLAEIAARYRTAMADAMIAACVAAALATGFDLAVPERPAPPPMVRGARPRREVDWERMVRGNSDHGRRW